jgi:hypothetical protein
MLRYVPISLVPYLIMDGNPFFNRFVLNGIIVRRKANRLIVIIEKDITKVFILASIEIDTLTTEIKSRGHRKSKISNTKGYNGDVER